MKGDGTQHFNPGAFGPHMLEHHHGVRARRNGGARHDFDASAGIALKTGPIRLSRARFAYTH